MTSSVSEIGNPVRCGRIRGQAARPGPYRSGRVQSAAVLPCCTGARRRTLGPPHCQAPAEQAHDAIVLLVTTAEVAGCSSESGPLATRLATRRRRSAAGASPTRSARTGIDCQATAVSSTRCRGGCTS
jgi:hypothetical protein